MSPSTSDAPEETSLVVALPAGGGGAGMFAQLRKALPAGTGLVVPDLPGRGRRTRAPRELTVPGLAAELAAELEPRIAGRPYAVFATCFSTIVGLELVWQLLERGIPPTRALLVSGRQPPDVAPPFEALDKLSDEEVLDGMRRFWPSELDWESMPKALHDILLRQTRRDNELGLGYVYEPRGPLPVPVIAYQGMDDPGVTVPELSDWGAHTSVSFTLRVVPGGHYFYMTHTDRLAGELGALLAGRAEDDPVS
ncbi:thioesterase II family protein [Streptomyces sp. NPDC056004]|uniref:thioesterase II family protein n=1 Tax=unclassified Streptomyces TaxID=2593676 RepID=UPI0035D9EF3F